MNIISNVHAGMMRTNFEYCWYELFSSMDDILSCYFRYSEVDVPRNV
uniref:Uncharacterized protein n=1 Tax=Amphimedon queenslandica TaxID=400682 RepID=A0A1X7VRK1_AMPQE